MPCLAVSASYLLRDSPAFPLKHQFTRHSAVRPQTTVATFKQSSTFVTIWPDTYREGSTIKTDRLSLIDIDRHVTLHQQINVSGSAGLPCSTLAASMLDNGREAGEESGEQRAECGPAMEMNQVQFYSHILKHPHSQPTSSPHFIQGATPAALSSNSTTRRFYEWPSPQWIHLLMLSVRSFLLPAVIVIIGARGLRAGKFFAVPTSHPPHSSSSTRRRPSNAERAEADPTALGCAERRVHHTPAKMLLH